MRITLFTVEEANRALVEVRPLLERLRGMNREFDRLEARAAILAVATSGAAPGNPDALELAELTEKRRKLGETITRGLRALHERGCMVKDIESGLCDFYALAGDRLVFLCWRADEPEVAHWHTLEGGFQGRQSLKNAGLE